jgi:hypothetical protein
MRNYFHHKLNFELLVLGIILFPFIYASMFWNISIIHIAHCFHVYLFVSILIYFMALWFSILDSRKENFEDLWPIIRRIRIIWAVYSAAVGFLLFYHSLNEHLFDHKRLYGVMLALFLFASGNFQANIHSSSAFAGNRWIFDEKQGAKFKKSQRFIAKLYFWVGIFFTIFFIVLPENLLYFLFISLGVTVFYGIFHRLILNLVKN